MSTPNQPKKFFIQVFGKKLSQTEQFIEALQTIPWPAFWNSALAIGGVFLTIYFSSIGYLPDLEIKDITGTLAAIAIIGVYFMALTGLGLILPTLFIKPTKTSDTISLIAQATLGALIATFTLVFLTDDYKHKKEDSIFIGCMIAILMAASISAHYHRTKK